MWEAEAFIGRLVDLGGPELMATGGDTSPGSRHSRPCPFLLSRSEAYRCRGLDCRGVGGRERSPAAAVTEAGVALNRVQLGRSSSVVTRIVFIWAWAQPTWRSAASRLRPHYGDARGVGEGDHRVGVSVVDKRRYYVDGVDPRD